MAVPVARRPVTRQASALTLPDHRAGRPRPTTPADLSNTDLWRWYSMPEVRSVADWIGSGVGRVSFRPCLDMPGKTGDRCPALVNPDGTIAEGADERLARDADAFWRTVRSPLGGQSELFRQLAICLEVAADGWLFTYTADDGYGYDPNGEVIWLALARSALKTRGGMYEIDPGIGADVKVPIPQEPGDPGGLAIRAWKPDPQRPAKASSWVQSITDLPTSPLRLLAAIYDAVAAVALSRLNAGLWLVPDDQDPQPFPQAQEVPDGPPEIAVSVLGEPLADSLYDQFADHVEASASVLNGFDRVVPAIQSMNSELVDKVKWLEVARSMDPELGKRIEDLRYRVAIASPADPSMLLGLGATNHWNAEAITIGEFQRSVQPDCELICDVTSPHVLRNGMLALGHAPESVDLIRVGYDPDALLADPDLTEPAGEAHERGAITDDEYRQAMGLGSFTGPDEGEMKARLVIELAKASPEYDYLLPIIDLPARPRQAVEAEPVIEVESSESRALPAVRQASVGDETVGRELVAVATRYEEQLAVLCESIVASMVRRAGNRVASVSLKAGWKPLRAQIRSAPPELIGAVPGVMAQLEAEGVDDSTGGDLLSGALPIFATQFAGLTERAQRRAVTIAGGDWDRLEVDAEQASAAAWALAGSMLVGAARSRFRGDLPEEGTGEGTGLAEFGVSLTIVRASSAVAGGMADPVSGAAVDEMSSTPLRSIATGPLAERAMAQGGLQVVGVLWDWGEEDRTPFEPHLDLHGVFGETLDDFDGWECGDHLGCRCHYVPVTMEVQE